MTAFPRLETERLVLRAFTRGDAPTVRRLAGDRAVAAGTATIPHPYPDGAAEAWIAGHAGSFQRGESLTFAVERRSDGALVGAVGLRLELEHARAELGYWIGKPYWGDGLATEAAAAAVRHAFEAYGLNRVYAYHFTNNPASGRVLQKLGMTYEGRRRRHTLKWGTFLDSDMYAVVRGDRVSA
jgi:ribosomal-protein-alanine N-acetyltransferase